MEHQYRHGITEEEVDNTVDTIMTDLRFMDILRILDWNTMSASELDSRFPGCRDTLHRMESVDAIFRRDGMVRIHESLQSLGLDFNDMQMVREALYFDREETKINLGFNVLYIVDLLISLYFRIEPCWEGDSERLLKRSGMVDDEGHLTGKGEGCAFSLFSTIANVFDIYDVEPKEMLIRWS